MKKITDKTIEQLEGKVYPTVTDSTRLVFTVTSLRKKKLADFTTEDIRVCIGQYEGLPYLIPMAIQELKKNILAEGSYYEGDLLSNVLTADKTFWINHKTEWEAMYMLYEENKALFEADNKYRQIRKKFAEFSFIHKND
jgi:hypothetical protein